MKKLAISSAAILGEKKAAKVKQRGDRASRIPELIEASINVFASVGYGGYSINRVAADVGVRLSTLQHYFPTREKLLQATIREMYRRYVERYANLGTNKLQSPEARLDALIDEFFDEILIGPSNVSQFVLESWTLAEHEPYVSELVREGNKQFQQIWLNLIATINPSLSEKECSIRASLIEAHAQGLMVFCRRGGPGLPDSEALRHATKVVWRALSKAA